MALIMALGAWLNRLRQQGLKALPTGVANYREQ